MKTNRVIGVARVIDVSEDGTTCRVRLIDEGGLPTGEVRTVKFMPDTPESRAWAEQCTLPTLSDHDLDTAARQNVYYNSHQPVIIE
jgi:hypothetical protein